MKGALNMPNEKEVKEVVEETTEKEVEQEQVEKTADPLLPTTEEELNKLLQSSSSKAKGEILKELGFKSVKEIQEAIKKGAGIEELNKQLEDLTKERDTYLGERDELKGVLLERDNQKLLRDNQIPEELADTFLKFVDNDVKEGETRQEAAKRIKDTLFKAVGVEVKIGVEKTKDPTKGASNDALRRAMGLK